MEEVWSLDYQQTLPRLGGLLHYCRLLWLRLLLVPLVVRLREIASLVVRVLAIMVVLLLVMIHYVWLIVVLLLVVLVLKVVVSASLHFK